MIRATLPTRIKLEAAAWIARLHSDDRSPEDELGLQQWLAEDEKHRHAFSLVTNAWVDAGGAVNGLADPPRGWTRRRILAGAVLASVLSCVGLGTLLLSKTYQTAKGERRRIALSDGSFLLLDTATRVDVVFHSNERRVTLSQGRAHFQVASDPRRPFIVSADHQEVIAIGTAFDVAKLDDGISVVLLQGKVAVKPDKASPNRFRMIEPGERIILNAGTAMRLDRPPIEVMTAWQNGRLILEGEPLSKAVAMMNRYGSRPLVIGDASLGNIEISGVYTTDDSEAFAHSVSLLLSISAVVEPDRILLVKGEPDMPVKI